MKHHCPDCHAVMVPAKRRCLTKRNLWFKVVACPECGYWEEVGA